MADRKPKVVGFCCDKHAADSTILSVRSGRTYDTSLRIIRVPCSGRVDGIHILNALEEGADAVFVLGCLEKNCYYDTGSVEGRKRVEYVKSMLSEAGLEPERVEMFNVSSSNAWKFPEIVSKMTEVARRLGPIGSAGGGDK